MKTFSIIAAHDGDVYHDSIEAADNDQAYSLARRKLAADWHMTETLEQYIAEGDEEGFDGELDGFAVDPEPERAELQPGSASDLDLVLRMAARFASEGAISDNFDREPGDPLPADVEAAIARLRASEPPAITVAVSVSGGILQWGGADAPGVKLIVVDYDQDGAPPHETVDMAEPGDRPELACVREETVETNPEAIARIVEKHAELELREQRYAADECIECGNDMSAPSAAGAEDGVCGECIGGGIFDRPGETEAIEQAAKDFGL